MSRKLRLGIFPHSVSSPYLHLGYLHRFLVYPSGCTAVGSNCKIAYQFNISWLLVLRRLQPVLHLHFTASNLFFTYSLPRVKDKGQWISQCGPQRGSALGSARPELTQPSLPVNEISIVYQVSLLKDFPAHAPRRPPVRGSGVQD